MLQRRRFLKGIGATSLAAVLASPELARAQAETLQEVETKTAIGDTVRAGLAVPETTPAAGVLLIHEWWGLNDQIKSVAAELARQGYIVVAADLYEGEVADDPERARELSQGVDFGKARSTLAAWLRWLKTDDRCTGKVATIGWCLGGGWSLQASLAEPVDATVIYYGRVDGDPSTLRNLQGPVLGHFATQDRFITRDMVEKFTEAMETAGQPVTIHFYDADHAFANPTGDNYDREDAQLAWSRTLDFLDRNLRL